MPSVQINSLSYQTLVQKAFIELALHPENKWLYANWIGTPTIEQVKEGLEDILTAFKEHHIHYLLNDNRQLTGTWSGAMEWIVEDWAPRAAQSGWKAVAFIYSPDVFAQFSVDSLMVAGDAETSAVAQKSFRGIQEAIDWLDYQ